ncbi:MAG: dTDP-4-dehydrorhamnose 3,5-epimerase [Kiritimatiellia bacterium]
MNYKVVSARIPDVFRIRAERYDDPRGFFWMTYRKSEFRAFGLSDDFVQDNHSRSVKNVLRGLHYQKEPMSQGKLVMVLSGEIYDVAVDIRPGSATFGQYEDIVLSSGKPEMLYIPPGFAHGFCVLSAHADVLYKVTREYSPEHEAGIIWNDPGIGIKWPVENPILSEKDQRLPRLKRGERL